MNDRNRKSLARSLGEFVGHIWRGVSADPSKDRREISRRVEHEQRDVGGQKVILRRTTIEEVEVDHRR